LKIKWGANKKIKWGGFSLKNKMGRMCPHIQLIPNLEIIVYSIDSETSWSKLIGCKWARCSLQGSLGNGLCCGELLNATAVV